MCAAQFVVVHAANIYTDRHLNNSLEFENILIKKDSRRSVNGPKCNVVNEVTTPLYFDGAAFNLRVLSKKKLGTLQKDGTDTIFLKLLDNMDEETSVNYPLKLWDTLVLTYIAKAKLREQKKEYEKLKKEIKELKIQQHELKMTSVSLLCAIYLKEKNLVLLTYSGFSIEP